MTSPLDLDLNIADRRAQGRLSRVGAKVMAGSSNQKPLLIRNSAGPVTIRAWRPSHKGDREFDNVDLATATVRRAIGVADRVPSTGTLPLAVLSTPVTSGLLVSGKRYFIKTFVAGDSFTNVGAASNASGVLFTATGTTPATWTNASALQEVTADLSVDATAAEVQTALNATAAVTALGGVTVTKLGTGSYEVLFNSLGAQQAMEGPVNWNMAPGSVVSVSRIVPGSATVREVQLIRLLVNPYCYGEFTTALPAAAAAISTVQGATADLPATKRITLDPQPYDGHMVITLDSGDPFEVPFDASASQIQAMAGELYEVSRKSETQWDISGVDPAQDVAITVDVSKLVVHLGVSGDMPLNTVALHRAFAATTAKTITLLDQVDITWPGELPQKVYQGEIEIARDILDLSAIVPTPIPASDYATLAALIGAKQGAHANLAAIVALTTHAFGLGLLTKDGASAILSYISGQPLNSGLTAISALSTAIFGRSLLTAANAPAARTLLEAAPLASPALTGTPTAPTAANEIASTQIATTEFVHALIEALANGAPATIDSINELAAAIGDDPNFAATVAASVATKLAKASNLSDLTDAFAARGNLGLAQVALKDAANAFILLQTFNAIASRNVDVSQLADPAAPTVTPIGNNEGVTWTYKIVALLSDGTPSAAGPAGSTAAGDETLDAINRNSLTWPAVAGAASYDVYRTATTGTSPATLGKVANVPTNAYTDTGAAGDGASAPATNSTGAITAHHFAGAGESITLLRPGTGAIARTLEDRISDFVNVKDFGATGDGVTNDTAAIEAARLVANASNKTLSFPRGVYKVVPGGIGDITASVYGPDALIKAFTNVDLPLLSLNYAEDANGAGHTLELKAVSGLGLGTGLYIKSSDYSTYRIGGFGLLSKGIHLDGSGNGTHIAVNDFFINVISSCAVGILASGGNGTVCESNRFFINYFANCSQKAVCLSNGAFNSPCSDNVFEIVSLEITTDADGIVCESACAANRFAVRGILGVGGVSPGTGKYIVAQGSRNKWTLPNFDLALLNKTSTTDVFNTVTEAVDDGSARSQLIGSAPPASGYWQAGDFMWNNSNTRPDGWRCVVSGTPGTWIQMGSKIEGELLVHPESNTNLKLHGHANLGDGSRIISINDGNNSLQGLEIAGSLLYLNAPLGIQVPVIPEANAFNNTYFISAETGKMSFKDSGGVVSALY